MHSRNLFDWFLGALNVFVIWGLGSICSSYASQELGMNSIVYVCTLFLTCSVFLLAYAGPGKNSISVLRSGETLGYGMALILSFIVSFGLFSQVTPVEGELLQMFTAIISVFASFFLFNRVPNGLQIVGLLFIAAGVIYVTIGLPIEKIAVVTFLVLILAFFQTLRSFMGENHKEFNNAAKYSKTPIKDQLRIIGFIMFIVSALFFVIALPLAFIQTYTGTIIYKAIPTLQDFLYFDGIVFGVIVGIVLILPERFLEFNALTKLKTENYLALGAFGPFATMFWQKSTQGYTGLDLTEFTLDDIYAAALITVGGLIVVASKIMFKVKDKDLLNEYIDYLETEESEKQESYDIILNTLKFYASNKTKAADKLGLPIIVLDEIIENKGSLKDKYLKTVAHIYKNEILTKDSLTKINNRVCLERDLRQLNIESTDYAILFMDLNKFKAINDNFGHDSGDIALQTAARRMTDFENNNIKVYRLGGDEFLMIAKKQKNEMLAKISNEIKQKVSHPFVLDKFNVVVSVGVSVGLVKSQDYPGKTAEDLMGMADELMYKDKNKNR